MGRSDPLLNQKGICEVREATRLLRGETFDLLLHGGKKRVRQTTELVLEELYCPLVQLDGRIGEMDFGLFEGLTAEEITVRYPQQWKEYMENWTNYTFPEGGNTLAFFLQCSEYIHGVLRDHPGAAKILIIAHKGFILCAYTALLHQNPDTVFDNDIKTGGILRASL